MASKDVGHILKHENAWSDSLDCIYKYRETITCIINAHLVAKTAERLAGRSADYNIYLVDFRILKPFFEKLFIASALQIPVISVDSSFHHFITYGTESRCLESERQAATTSKQVEYQRLLLNMWCKHPIYLITKFRHCLVITKLWCKDTKYLGKKYYLMQKNTLFNRNDIIE